ncbi:MAG: ribonucleotide reductase N-terminal alpha domain-containing protein, partial [Candidatus Paceibacterota bacterium]
RSAKDLAKEEKDPKKYTEIFYNVLSDFKFVPGGRILSNAGTNLKGTTYINCFVDGLMGKDQDSMNGIMDALKRQAMILKSEGGYGFCADVLRPRGSVINGIGALSPGSVRMLDMWDTQSATITRGAGIDSNRKDIKKKIRKGAQMVTMSIWHPDVKEFITSKQTAGRLTKFNMSVLITDEFMTAVENDDTWEFIFPDYEKCQKEYKEFWDGNIKNWIEKGYPVKIYDTIQARSMWNKIMESTYNRNEPGVLFVDNMNYWNNLYYCEYITATNPCGEQILPIGGVCLLGSLNLTQFVKEKSWDYSLISELIPHIVRMMDNVNDITHVPLLSQEENLKNKRRIGIGIMGLGSALMMQQIKYGSEEANQSVDELMNFIKNEAYKASALLAKEKGTFLLYDEE